MAYRHIEARRAQDLAGWHRRVAEQRGRHVHLVLIEDAEPIGCGFLTISLRPSVRRRRMDPHPATA